MNAISITSPFVFVMLTESDPRRAFALIRPVPLVNFILCATNSFSPQLQILRDPKELKKELIMCARIYLHLHVIYDVSQSTIILPGLLEMYWKDFCAFKTDIVKTVIRLSSKKMAVDLQIILNSKKMKLSFTIMTGKSTITV
jgi:hypothetical protein